MYTVVADPIYAQVYAFNYGLLDYVVVTMLFIIMSHNIRGRDWDGPSCDKLSRNPNLEINITA